MEATAERAPGDHFFDAICRKQNAGNVSVLLDERVLASLASHLATVLQRELGCSNMPPVLLGMPSPLSCGAHAPLAPASVFHLVSLLLCFNASCFIRGSWLLITR